MALRLFVDSTGWETAHNDTLYTAVVLEARPAHAAFAQPLRKLLEDWAVIDRDRRAADAALVAANAQVGALDEELDAGVEELSRLLLVDAKGDRKSKLFSTFFPEGAAAIVRLGLEAELARVAAFPALAQQHKSSASVTAAVAKLAESAAPGTKALEARKQATVAQALVRLRQHEWKQAANAARRSIESALEQHAATSGLRRSFSDAFFPAASQRAKARAKPDDVRADAQPEGGTD